MASVEIRVSLPAELAEQVRVAVESGEFSSSSEVIGDALRDWSERRGAEQSDVAHLREQWTEACEDSTSGVVAGEVLDRLERKYQSMVDADEAKKKIA